MGTKGLFSWNHNEAALFIITIRGCGWNLEEHKGSFLSLDFDADKYRISLTRSNANYPQIISLQQEPYITNLTNTIIYQTRLPDLKKRTVERNTKPM